MKKFLLWVDERAPVPCEVPDGATLTVGRGGEPGAASHGPQRRDGQRFELQVPSKTLSSEHAQICFLEDGATVRDLGSKNGTFLLLAPGEVRRCTTRIQLGAGVMIELRSAGQPDVDQIPISDPEDLRRRVEAAVGGSATAVRLVSSCSSPAGSPRTLLPLPGALFLVVEWAAGTFDSAAERWTRALVNRAILDQAAARRDCSFTAASRARRDALAGALRAAPFDEPVLLLGKSGCGKSVLARDIHDHSRRASGPFVEVNCSAIPHEIFESQMFGHVQGAFTGAHKSSPGFVLLAEGGTLFLDEVGDLPAPQQAKLLKLLDDGQYWPVGGSRPQRANIRVLTATNRDLVQMVPERFRDDLYHRIATLTIDIPDPGPEDIQRAVTSLLPELADRNQTSVEREEIEEIAALASQATYPGQFRGLRNLLARYLVFRDPLQSVDANWRKVVSSPATAQPNPAPAPAPSPPSAGGLEAVLPLLPRLEKLARLQIARSATSVADLARRLGRTEGRAYQWLTAQGLTSGDLGNTSRLRELVQAEVELLGGCRPFLDDLFVV